MSVFGAQSEAKLVDVHPDLVRVLRRAITMFDFAVIEGHRGEAAQRQAVKTGRSQVQWPHGKHNSTPSRAVDIAPWPLDWSDQPKAIERFVFMQGVIWAAAHMEGVAVRLGLDWDGDCDMRDETFRDYPHVELA